jgi:hypothetical protein
MVKFFTQEKERQERNLHPSSRRGGMIQKQPGRRERGQWKEHNHSEKERRKTQSIYLTQL